MSNVKWAVVYFWYNGTLNCESWYCDLSSLQEAEEARNTELKLDNNLSPQNLQVVQYEI